MEDVNFNKPDPLFLMMMAPDVPRRFRVLLVTSPVPR
jgi:hypothetical protein